MALIKQRVRILYQLLRSQYAGRIGAPTPRKDV